MGGKFTYGVSKEFLDSSKVMLDALSENENFGTEWSSANVTCLFLLSGGEFLASTCFVSCLFFIQRGVITTYSLCWSKDTFELVVLLCVVTEVGLSYGFSFSVVLEDEGVLEVENPGE